MTTTITISGALARIYTLLARKGYGVKGHQITQSLAGVKLLQISFDGTQVDKDRLSAEIKNLNPEYGVVSIAGPSAIKEMVDKFPHIVPLVKAYGDSFSPETRNPELFEAGKKIGAFNYKKEWSFGSPLKMPVALRRSLVPALGKFGQVDATDTTVTLPKSPFCEAGNPMKCCCEFLTGFMQGFLDAGPRTKNTHVQKVTCTATGALNCTYSVTVDA